MFCAICFDLNNLKNLRDLHGVVLLLKTRTLLKVTLRNGCFSCFWNCTNSTTMQKNISYELTYHQDFEWVYHILWSLVPIWQKLVVQILFHRFTVVQRCGEGFQRDLNLFYSMFPFRSPWKHQKSEGVLGFSRGVKWEHWPEMAQQKFHAPVILYQSLRRSGLNSWELNYLKMATIFQEFLESFVRINVY